MAEGTQSVQVGALVAAIEAATIDFANLKERLAECEEVTRVADEENSRLRSQLQEMLPRLEDLKRDLRLGTQIADDAEARSKAHQADVESLITDLSIVHDDIVRIGKAIEALKRF